MKKAASNQTVKGTQKTEKVRFTPDSDVQSLLQRVQTTGRTSKEFINDTLKAYAVRMRRNDEIAAFIKGLDEADAAGINLDTVLDKVPRESALRGCQDIIEHVAKLKTAKAAAKLSIELDPFTYGQMCAGAMVHGVKVEEMIATYLNMTACDWQNNGYPIEN